MMSTHSLDSILPGSTAEPSDEGNVISLTTRLLAGSGGVLAELHRTDVLTGQGMTELVRLKHDGQRSASLVLRANPDEAEQRIAAALSKHPGAGLATLPGAAVALREGLAPLAAAITRLSPGLDARPVLSGDRCALFDPVQATLHLFRDTASPVPRALDTAPMDLGGWRYLTGICFADDFLYAAVADPVAGFDLFRCDASDAAPEFEKVLTRGAYRFALNGAVASMVACDKGLLLGTAALAGTAKPVGDWGPELILVTPDGRGDLIAGQPRFSPEGMLLPASTMLPGMGHSGNAAIRAMTHAEGQTAIAIQDFAGAPQEDRHQTTADLFDYRGPVRLYVSDNLTDWRELDHDLSQDLGTITCMCLAPGGLFIGHEGLGPDSVPVRFVPGA